MAGQSRPKFAMAISVLLAALTWPLMSLAQVQKCVDPTTGKITFSDRGCNTGEESTAVRVSPANSIDGSQYRQQASAPANPYADQANQADPERRGPRVAGVGTNNVADRQQQKLCKEASTPHKGAHGLTAAQRVAAAQECAGINLPSPASNAASTSAPAAPIVNCDSSGCWDASGARYNRGAGDTHFPANGGPACQLIHGNMICP